MLFRVKGEAERQFQEAQAAVSSRGNKVRLEHYLTTHPGTTSRDVDFYQTVAHRVARMVSRRFGCKADVVKYMGCDEHDYVMPQFKLIISFL
jgi:hypothetical protein